jgi:hypothetical protein
MAKKHGGAQVVLLDAWRSARAMGYGRWDHLFKGHLPAREVPNGLHVGDGDSVALPLRDGGRGDLEVRCESCGSALLRSKPSVEVHDYSLGFTKPESQALPKPELVSIRLTMDAERRQRFKDWFAGPPCKGSRKELIRLTGLTKGRVAQLFSDEQPFGERAARDLAVKLKLADPRYFERAAVPAPPRTATGKVDFNERRVTDSQWAVLDDLEALPEAERAKIVDQIKEQAAVFKAYREEMIRKLKESSASEATPSAQSGVNVTTLPAQEKPRRRATSPLSGQKTPSKKVGVK